MKIRLRYSLPKWMRSAVNSDIQVQRFRLEKELSQPFKRILTKIFFPWEPSRTALLNPHLCLHFFFSSDGSMYHWCQHFFLVFFCGLPVNTLPALLNHRWLIWLALDCAPQEWALKLLWLALYNAPECGQRILQHPHGSCSYQKQRKHF